MRLHELIEGRDAPLYHGTPMVNFFGIIAEDSLEGTDPMDDIGMTRLSVRFTRSYAMALHFSGLDHQGNFGVVIEVNQRTLSQNYKIQPFADHDNGAERNMGRSESEEVVLHDRVEPLSRVMTRFYANPDDIMWLTDPKIMQTHMNGNLLDWDETRIKEMANYILNHPLRVDIK